MDLCFDIFFKDEKVGRVEIRNSVLVKNEVYTDDFHKQPYARIKTAQIMVDELHDRVMCRRRWDDFQLNAIGLKEYNFYEIIKRTHGRSFDDFFWLRFDGDTCTYDDVKLRD